MLQTSVEAAHTNVKILAALRHQDLLGQSPYKFTLTSKLLAK